MLENLQNSIIGGRIELGILFLIVGYLYSRRGLQKMVRSRNISHTIQLIAGILFAVYLLVNVNSLSGLKEYGDNIPGATIEFTDELAGLGDRFQTVAENGFLQSVISAVIGEGVTYSNSNYGTDVVVVEPPVEANSGNLGEVIQKAGEMVAGIWVFGDDSMTTVKHIEVREEDLPLIEELTLAVEPFGHLSRPTISHVPVKDEYLNELQYDNVVV